MRELLDLPDRTVKPREDGVTHVIDKGLSVAEIDGMIEVAGDSSTSSSSAGAPRWRPATSSRKLERYRAHGIPVVLGGTLTELAIARDRLDELIAWAQELGLAHFEISDGTIALEHERKLELIERLAQRLHGAVRGRLQGRHRRDHAALRVGRA